MSPFPLPIFFFPQSLPTPAVKQRGLMNWRCDPHVQFFPWLRIEWHFLRVPKLIVLLPREGHLFISTCSCAASKVLCAFHCSLVLFFLLLLQILWRTQLVMVISSSLFDATAFTGKVETRITWQFISMSFLFFSWQIR